MFISEKEMYFKLVDVCINQHPRSSFKKALFQKGW